MTARLQETAPAATHEPSFGVMDFMIVLARSKWMIAATALAAAVTAGGISFVMPESYTATAKILPPQQSGGGAAALLGQLGGLGAALGPGLGMKNPADLYVGMLKSRTITDAVIERFELRSRYESETMFDARLVLDRRTTFLAAKDGIITIEVDDREPQFAADLANAFVAELSRLTDSLALNETSQRRAFFEKQVTEAREGLAAAEGAMRKTQERTGLIRLEEQGQVIIQAIATLKAQIMAKEVQLSSMRSFATDANPDLARAQKELEGLRVQLARLEREGGRDNGIFVPSGKVPELGVEYLRAIRELKYREALFEVMVKQFEMARLEEARNAAIVQVIDKAVAPDRRSSPRRTIMVVVGFLGGLLLAICIALVLDALARARRDAAQSERLAQLKHHLVGR